MSRITEIIDTVTEIVAGKAFTLRIPIGPVYHKLQIRRTNVTAAQVQNLFLYINGKPVMEFADLAELDALNDYYERSYPASHSILYFDSPEFQEEFKEMTALGTAGLTTVTLKGTIDAAAVNPDLEFFASKTPVSRAPGLIRKVRKYHKSFATAGQKTVQDVPYGALIAAIHFMKDDVSRVKVDTLNKLGERRTEVDAPKTVLQGFQEEYRTPSADFTTVDFPITGLIRDALVGTELQELTLLPTLDTSGDCDILVEYLDTLVGL